MKTFYYNIILLSYLFCTLQADTWTIFWYMDSTDALSDMAIKNMTDVMRGKPNDNINMIIQLHAYHDVGLRYHVTENGLIFTEEITLTGNSTEDFVNAAQWAFADNTSDHIMFIIANHGFGALDPEWNSITQQWELDSGGLSEQCPLKKNHLKYAEAHKQHRGFMFSNTAHTYLTNQNLVDGLSNITKTVLNNKKMDILAFDTCMGDMFEIAYLVAPYADYLVGNQSCSLLDGFDYQGVMQVFNQGPVTREACTGMVRVFDNYYSKYDASGIYTHAALDLAQIYTASNALDNAVSQLLNMPELHTILVLARDASPRFCLWPMYTDLVAFCKCVEKEISMLEQSEALLALKGLLQNVYDAVASMVVARCGGFSTQGLAHGVAIYLPPTSVDSSYYNTDFVQESQWITLLEYICNN